MYDNMRETRLTVIEKSSEGQGFHLLPKLLVWSGISDAKRHDRLSNTVRIISTFFLHFSVFEFFLMVAVASQYSWYAWKSNVSYLISTFASLMSWHCLRSKRRNLLPLMEKLKLLRSSEKRNISASIVVACLVIFAFPLAQTFATEEAYINNYFDFFSLGFEFGNRSVRLAFILVQFTVVSSCILYFTFSCLITYLAMCTCASSMLEDFEKDLVASDFASSPQGDLVKKYRGILDFTTDVQFVFSNATFYLCVAYITSNFGALSTFFLIQSDFIGRSIILEHAFMVIFNTVSLFALFRFAGQIPIRMSDVKSAYFKKHAEYAALLPDQQAKLYVLNRMMDAPEVVFSGCDVIHYRKVTILLVLSCFITYGLFVINFEN